jgi:hypothetical protein
MKRKVTSSPLEEAVLKVVRRSRRPLRAHDIFEGYCLAAQEWITREPLYHTEKRIQGIIGSLVKKGLIKKGEDGKFRRA